MKATPPMDNVEEQVDRRTLTLSSQALWSKLTTSQRFAYYTLAKLGYRLLFVRSHGTSLQAITKQDNHLATIDNWGDIDFNPKISIRPL